MPGRSGLSDDNYDPSHFYVRSTDGRGHGEKMSLTVPPDLLGRVQALIESRKFPYRTTHDLMRDALLHRLHALNDIVLDPNLTEFLNQQRLAHVLEQQRMMVQQAKETIDLTRDHLQACWNANDMSMLVDGLIAAWQAQDGMREPYRTDLRTEIASWTVRVPRTHRLELIEAGVVIGASD